jgi:hypothetical protein
LAAVPRDGVARHEDPAELLDVDVDQLAGPVALVALWRLDPDPAELAHPDPGEDARDGRERHPERLCDLRAREAQPPRAAIASTRRSSVRFATDRGADDRSSSPSSPSAR